MIALRQHIVLDGIRVNQVVIFGQEAFCIPFQLETVVFFILQPLVFFQQIELEDRADCRAELKGNILMCVSAAVSSGLHIHADCVRTFNPFLGTQSERMQPGFALKVVEFDHFEIGVVHDFPSAEKLQG